MSVKSVYEATFSTEDAGDAMVESCELSTEAPIPTAIIFTPVVFNTAAALLKSPFNTPAVIK